MLVLCTSESGEYDVCDVTLSMHPHRASWKVCLTMVRIEPVTFLWHPLVYIHELLEKVFKVQFLREGLLLHFLQLLQVRSKTCMQFGLKNPSTANRIPWYIISSSRICEISLCRSSGSASTSENIKIVWHNWRGKIGGTRAHFVKP